MSGQCLRMPARNRANFSGSDVVVPSSLRTCTCTSAAPASYAACVDSICSATVIGTAGLSFFVGTEPVMATVMMHGVLMVLFASFVASAAWPGAILVAGRPRPLRAARLANARRPLCCTPCTFSTE